MEWRQVMLPGLGLTLVTLCGCAIAGPGSRAKGTDMGQRQSRLFVKDAIRDTPIERIAVAPGSPEPVRFAAEQLRVNTFCLVATPEAAPTAIRERGGLAHGPGHIFREFLPDAALFATHPEYFSVIEGKRTVTGI